MAKGKKGASPKVIKATAAQLQDAIRDAAGARQRAKNANENKSNALADYALRSGFSKRALALGLELNGLDDIKRTDFVREVLMIHQMMGWGQQADLFDDVGAQIAEAAKRAEDEAGARKGKSGSPGLPLEELAKGIKPLDETAPGKARRGRKTSVEERVASRAESVAGGSPRNALPGTPALGEPAARQPEAAL